MISYSKFSYTRHDNLSTKDVAMGYVEMANKVLEGKIHIDGDDEMREKEYDKARRILANLRANY